MSIATLAKLAENDGPSAPPHRDSPEIRCLQKGHAMVPGSLPPDILHDIPPIQILEME